MMQKIKLKNLRLRIKRTNSGRIENMDRENLFLNMGAMKAHGVENPQGFGNDERRYTPVTDFVAQSNGSIHRKVREERKAQLHKSLNSEKIIRPGTRIPRIKWIYTDNTIRAHPRQPLRQLTSPTRMAVAISGDPCYFVNNLEGKISYQWLFYPVIEQGVAQ